MKLKVSISPKILRLVVIAKRLAIAIGRFVKVKHNLESIEVRSEPNIVPNKVLSHGVVVQDIPPTVRPFKNILEGVGLDDGEPYFLENYVVGAPAFQDYTLGPQVIKVFTKSPILINVGVLSQPALTFQRSFSDQFFATDDVDGALTNQDDVTLEFFKSTDNTPAFSDINIFSISKILLELPQVISLGILVSQNYTEDATYFVGDYVGESRAFS